MAGSNHIRKLLLILVSLPLLSPCAGAWSNGGYSADQANPDYGTHDWIAEAALALQTEDVTFLKTTYHTEFLLGTEAPDNPEYIGDTTKHHVYFHASGQLQDDICAVRAAQIYQIALGYLLTGDNYSAAFDIGVLAHYVSDPGVFGHTMGAYTDWGGEVHHSDYENKFESMLGSLSPPTGQSLGDSDAYNATLDLGESITFGQGAIQSNIWMDSNYDWADGTFVASAMASLHESVAAVAAVINHLIAEASSSSPPPPPPPEVPLPPLSLTASVEGAHVVLTWLPPPSDGGAILTGYTIFRGTDPSDPSYLTIVSSSTHSWVDVSSERGKTYYYWVAAENSVGLSDLSQATSASVPKGNASLTLPIALSAISIAIASGGILLWRRWPR